MLQRRKYRSPRLVLSTFHLTLLLSSAWLAPAFAGPTDSPAAAATVTAPAAAPVTTTPGNKDIDCIAMFTQMLAKADPRTQAIIGAYMASHPKEVADFTRIAQEMMAGNLSIRDPRTLATIEAFGSRLNDSGKLPQILVEIVEQGQKAGKIPAMPVEKRDALIARFTSVIDAELGARGMTRATQGVRYEDWVRLSNRVLSELDEAVAHIPPAERHFDNPVFVKAFEKQTGAKFVRGNDIQVLINGPASFAERKRLIEGAKKRIDVLSWAFYDDDTGKEYSQLLIQKAREGVEVRVMVDGQVAMQPGYNATLAEMEANGVQVIRWRNPDPRHPYDGQHRKMMIVDGKEMIAGGMNFGNVYSHLGPATDAKWRDTDVLVHGPVLGQGMALFRKLWNEQVKVLKSPGLKPISGNELPRPARQAADASIALVNHTPGSDEHIFRANLMAIESARDTVDIENAYFILNPAIYKALLRAKERGVRVLTNSAQSVDEPVVSVPILESVNRLVGAARKKLVKDGFEVYVKDGKDTLHSKYLAVDDRYASIMSYNLHPRSERYEGEMALAALNPAFATATRQMFEADIAKAIRVNEPIEIPASVPAKIGQQLFYDQL